MSVCVYIYMSVYIYIYMSVYIYINECVYIYIFIRQEYTTTPKLTFCF